MESSPTYWADRAALEWQVELGVTEAVQDAPVNRYALDPKPAVAKPAAAAAAAQAAPGKAPVAPTPAPAIDPVADARIAADAATSLETLAQAMAAFEHCELKRGARSFVFADGDPAARVMIVGEAPGRQEDIAGKPFVGQAGQLLDRMLAAITLDRAADDPARAVYITNVLPWRPPSNRTPTEAEIAMLLPFLERHITLANPDVLVLMGNTPCQALLGRTGITRARGQWAEVLGRPAMPMFHPAYLLRNTAAKREAWADLLAIQAKLRTQP
jgi:DNA polymerase